MKYRDLLDNLLLVINQMKIIASLNPNSVDAIIYKRCYNAYRLIKETESIDGVDMKGISRQFADYYGYDAPLLIEISKVEELFEKLKKQNKQEV